MSAAAQRIADAAHRCGAEAGHVTNIQRRYLRKRVVFHWQCSCGYQGQAEPATSRKAQGKQARQHMRDAFVLGRSVS